MPRTPATSVAASSNSWGWGGRRRAALNGHEIGVSDLLRAKAQMQAELGDYQEAFEG